MRDAPVEVDAAIESLEREIQFHKDLLDRLQQDNPNIELIHAQMEDYKDGENPTSTYGIHWAEIRLRDYLAEK
jgi:hypothetical protein